MEQRKEYILRLENHKLQVKYKGDWELDGIRNNFEQHLYTKSQLQSIFKRFTSSITLTIKQKKS